MAVAKGANSISKNVKSKLISPEVLMYNFSAYLFSIITLGIEFGIAIDLK